MAKKRTLDELRQNKEYGYKPPKTKKKGNKERPLAEWEKNIGKKSKKKKPVNGFYKDTKVRKTRGIEVNGHKIPNPKLHQQVSFIKSGIRILGYAALWWSIDIAATLLIMSEVVGIGEELV